MIDEADETAIPELTDIVWTGHPCQDGKATGRPTPRGGHGP